MARCHAIRDFAIFRVFFVIFCDFSGRHRHRMQTGLRGAAEPPLEPLGRSALVRREMVQFAGRPCRPTGPVEERTFWQQGWQSYSNFHRCCARLSVQRQIQLPVN